MRRLITSLVLGVLLLVAAAFMAPVAQQGQLRGYVDRNNNVICYALESSATAHLSCVHIPRDGVEVQLNLPKPGDSQT